jgi:hypothetical protein
VRERTERAHGPYRRGDSWRVIIVTAGGSRCTETFASERQATARIAEYEREFTSRSIGAAVEAYLAAQERRLTEGEIRQSTLDRERYHLRATLKLAEHGPLDLRKLTPAFAGKLYDQRSGAVDTHRNGLSVAKAFGAWCVAKGLAPGQPVRGDQGPRPATPRQAAAADRRGAHLHGVLSRARAAR